MIYVLACYGTRGDVEPGLALARELLHRGHEVRVAVPPDLIGFAEAAGIAAVPYGLDTQTWMDQHRDLWASILRAFWNIQKLKTLGQELWEVYSQCWRSASATLVSLADGADRIISGRGLEEPAANVAEYYDIPLATLHFAPARPNGQFLPTLPPQVGSSLMTLNLWLFWRMTKRVEDAQRRELGLAKASISPSRRIAERGSLDIQAYDECCFPGLASEWAKWAHQRPFVGALTMELTTDADEEVASWIASGTPPIYFGFGSVPVESARRTIEMISAACARLGERALICAAGTDVSDVLPSAHVKLVSTVSHAVTFPACRAVVHHGGAGTTAAGLRAGVPTLILWTAADQPLWGIQIKRLKVGSARRFSGTTEDTLVDDLRTILAPQYVARAREIANEMTAAAESVAAAADLIENSSRLPLAN
ncbi:glycosyltransferase [Mycolicibacterium sp. XJ1904]